MERPANDGGNLPVNMHINFSAQKMLPLLQSFWAPAERTLTLGVKHVLANVEVIGLQPMQKTPASTSPNPPQTRGWNCADMKNRNKSNQPNNVINITV